MGLKPHIILWRTIWVFLVIGFFAQPLWAQTADLNGTPPDFTTQELQAEIDALEAEAGQHAAGVEVQRHQVLETIDIATLHVAAVAVHS